MFILGTGDALDSALAKGLGGVIFFTKDIQTKEQFKNLIKDIEENPDCADEYFTCAACGEYKSLAGSIRYGEYRLCNDCVLLAEVSFELKKIKDIQELIDKMEDKRLESQCEFIKKDQKAVEN